MAEIKRLDFSEVKLYAVTSPIHNRDEARNKIEKMLAAGVDAVQLRTRELFDKDIITFGRELKELCDQHDALFILNNRPDLAHAIDADGVHLGHNDMPIKMAREVLGHRKIIGASTHSLPQALAAQKEGADYVSCGPLWATPTKPEYKEVGLGLIGLYRAALKVPFVAIGGIDLSNVDQVMNAGAKTIAVVRALFESEDTETVVKNFKEKLSAAKLASANQE